MLACVRRAPRESSDLAVVDRVTDRTADRRDGLGAEGSRDTLRGIRINASSITLR